MGEIHLISEARMSKRQTVVIAECDSVMEWEHPPYYFRCTCGDKYVSGVWLSAHITREGIGHRRQIVYDDD